MNVECQQPTQPFDGACQQKAVTKCSKCGRPICFQHAVHLVNPYITICWSCYGVKTPKKRKKDRRGKKK